MYTYSAYDLQIRSVFELPELPLVKTAVTDTDIEVRREPVKSVPDTVDGTGGRRIVATPEAVRLTYDSIGSFLVKDGDEIVCDPIDEEAENREFFRRLIQNELLGLLLYQRDHLVLHASAVSVNGDAAMFIGPRGVGKSTTAAAFDSEGYAVLEDDVVAIRFDDGVPTVVPGVPQGVTEVPHALDDEPRAPDAGLLERERLRAAVLALPVVPRIEDVDRQHVVGAGRVRQRVVVVHAQVAAGPPQRRLVFAHDHGWRSAG